MWAVVLAWLCIGLMVIAVVVWITRRWQRMVGLAVCAVVIGGTVWITTRPLPMDSSRWQTDRKARWHMRQAAMEQLRHGAIRDREDVDRVFGLDDNGNRIMERRQYSVSGPWYWPAPYVLRIDFDDEGLIRQYFLYAT